MYYKELTREELERNFNVLAMERERLAIQLDKCKEEKREEMVCKNEAYAFILESGLYEQFKKYSRLKVCGDNPHQACCDWLVFEAKRRAQKKRGS
jgi:hypothetical protein